MTAEVNQPGKFFGCESGLRRFNCEARSALEYRA
jgi:hypothetical protein